MFVAGTEVGCVLGVGEEFSAKAKGVSVGDGRIVFVLFETWLQEDSRKRKTATANLRNVEMRDILSRSFIAPAPIISRFFTFR